MEFDPAPAPPATPSTRAEIVTLCGSTRFKEEINRLNAELTMAGKLVISIGVFGHVDLPERDWTTHGSADKIMLDRLHRQKIDLADRILVVNPGGYIGESTRSEIAYATAKGMPVEYLVPPEGGTYR
ncbi:hypothetical protein D1871_11345 [Nakamurella silvestris]|nr:hypothetical protein D1871_11345 [Nakamurella silvestris]